MKTLSKCVWLSFLFLHSCSAVAKEKCISYGSQQVAALKTFKLAINTDDPVQDFVKRIGHHDYRFLAVYGLGLIHPGLRSAEDRQLIEKFGTRNILGTSDALENEEHAKLDSEFEKYAATYNKLMANYLKSTPDC